jgi:molybdopterin-biosynthesis enzyme MoeA-like protein
MKKRNFYALIIGSEILNARREDAHFAFVQTALAKYGHTLSASFIIKDSYALIKQSFELILNDPNSVMFSFGGIGSTPDDLTREIAAEVFTNSAPQRHPLFAQAIVDRLGERAHPHPIKMADIPKGSELIHNPVNNMSGFSLYDRFFFVPGFPNMAHPMIESVIAKHFGTTVKRYRTTFIAECSEGKLVNIMHTLESTLDFSSLPMMDGTNYRVEISISDENSAVVDSNIKRFTDFLDTEQIAYRFI